MTLDFNDLFQEAAQGAPTADRDWQNQIEQRGRQLYRRSMAARSTTALLAGAITLGAAALVQHVGLANDSTGEVAVAERGGIEEVQEDSSTVRPTPDDGLSKTLESAANAVMGFESRPGFARVEIRRQRDQIGVLWKGPLPDDVAQRVDQLRAKGVSVEVRDVPYSKADIVAAAMSLAKARSTLGLDQVDVRANEDFSGLVVGVPDPRAVDVGRLERVAGMTVRLEQSDATWFDSPSGGAGAGG